MARDPHAARTLIAEVRAVVPRLVVERSDLDGLGVHRTFRLTSTDVKGLDDLASVVADQRVVSTRSVANGVEVTFSHRVVADDNSTFNVRLVADDLLRKVQKRKPRKKKAVEPKPE